MIDPFSSADLRILLVDDHPLFLEGLRNLLEAGGLQIIGLAQDGFEALAQARRLHPNLILMDIRMPNCNGLTATRLIKAEMPECKIVMLSMSEDDQDLFEAVKSGASGYLLKRLDAREFFDYLSDLQSGHPPFSSGLAGKILAEFARQASRPEEHGQLHNALASPPARGMPALSSRQVQILTLVAQGQTYRQVAETIGITERTVKYHMGEILERLHLQNRSQVVAYAAQRGFFRPDGD
jgi:two-component system NarL family response regulator